MTIGNLQGRAYTDPNSCEPPGICDRCCEKWMRTDLQWQYDVRGRTLQNLRILVCPRCLDEPSWQLKPIIVPPDPIPIKDPRPGFYASQEGPPPAPQSVVSLIYGPYPYGVPPTPPPSGSIETESGATYISLESGQPIELE